MHGELTCNHPGCVPDVLEAPPLDVELPAPDVPLLLPEPFVLEVPFVPEVPFEADDPFVPVDDATPEVEGIHAYSVTFVGSYFPSLGRE